MTWACFVFSGFGGRESCVIRRRHCFMTRSTMAQPILGDLESAGMRLVASIHESASQCSLSRRRLVARDGHRHRQFC